MPTRARVEELVARIERGEFLEVMPDFYAEDATAQENSQPPRVGLAALMEHERRALARSRPTRTRAVSIVVEGDRAVINWLFETDVGERCIRLDELAYQLWRGDRIVSERYFYDPAQLR